MKLFQMKNFCVIILSFTSLFVFGQEGKTDDQLAFDEMLQAYYDQDYDSALTLCQNFLSNHAESALVPRIKYNIGYILRETGHDKKSIPIFEELLASNYNEKERFGGLMEQYALYKHRSASNLADIYLDLGDYQLAQKYIRLFDKKYQYQHFGGNEMMAHEIYTARQYARLYHGQGKTDKAIRELIPYIFENGLASNKSLLTLLDKFLNERYSKEELHQLFVQARSTLTIKTEDKASIKLLGVRIEFLDFELFAMGNIDFNENLKLVGQEKWDKVFTTNTLFSKYLK